MLPPIARLILIWRLVAAIATAEHGHPISAIPAEPGQQLHFFSLSNLSAIGLSPATVIRHPQPLVPPLTITTTTPNPPAATAAPAPLFHIAHLASALEAKLRSLRSTELAVGSIQRIFDTSPGAHRYLSASATPLAANASQLATTLADRLAEKLRRAELALQRASLCVQADTSAPPSAVNPCPKSADISPLAAHYDPSQIVIKNSELPDASDASQALPECLGRETAALTIQQSYFVAAANGGGPLCTDSATSSNSRHLRRVLLASIAQKTVLLVLDHGASGAWNADQLQLQRTFASQAVRLLNARDRVAIVAVAGRSVSFYRGGSEQAARLHAANRANRERMVRYIAGLNGTGGQLEPSNHTLVFARAFAVLREIYGEKAGVAAADARPMQMVYIGRGLLSPLTEARRVLEAIAEGQRRLPEPVTLHTCAVVWDEKRVMYEKQFLKDVARQNFSKYSVAAGWLDEGGRQAIGAGRALVVRAQDTAADMFRTVATLFGHLLRAEEQLSAGLTVGEPRAVRFEADGSGSSVAIVVPMTRAVVNQTAPAIGWGVLGLDLYLSDLAEDVDSFNRERGAYAFIVDRNGAAVVHPSIVTASAADTDESGAPFYTDIARLEQPLAGPGFGHVRQRMLVEHNGTAKISIDAHRSVKYTWQRAAEQYVVCVVFVAPGPFTWRHSAGHGGRAASVNTSAAIEALRLHDQLLPDFLFHRVDWLPPPAASLGQMCIHFQQATSTAAATLFLAASAYKRPFVYLHTYRQQTAEERAHSARSAMAYLRDRSTVLANPGLLDAVRGDVLAGLEAMELLRRRHLAGDGQQDDRYIVRRYVATVATGVLQMFPGCVLAYDLEPRHRPWFVRAMAHPGRVVLTEPYLDAGGAGYIVTIAHTLHRSAHTNRPAAIVAIDVTLGFLYKLLLAAEPECARAPHQFKCFLMDDAGFVLAHPNVLEPAAAPASTSARRRRPLEHVTHIESYMANDLLNWRQLVEKRQCDDFGNRTRQRYYRFNTSLTEVLTNRVHGERTKYQLTAIAGTNVFVAWLNATADGGAAFCPCSTLDRICLNCHRMEPTNCECPCECPLTVRDATEPDDGDDLADLDTDNSLTAPHLHDICQPPPLRLPLRPTDLAAIELDSALLQCSDFQCDQFATQLDCLGVLGCEWCQLDIDAETYFAAPFCSQQMACYSGVLGAQTPYGADGDLGASLADAPAPASYSVVVPVIGALVVLCVVIGVAMYCYRQTVDGHSDALYNSAHETQPFGMPLARFDFDDSSRPDEGGGGGNGGSGPGGGGDLGGLGDGDLGSSALAGGKQAMAIISPYRVTGAATYRQPAPNAESDHGYSTMTPREDSEHQCFALAEPLLRGVGRRASSMSDSGSIGTSVSSPGNQQPQPQQPMGCGGAADGRRERRSPQLVAGATQLGVAEGGGVVRGSPHHVQAVVTVHRPMEMI